MTRLIVAPSAEGQIRRISAWWHNNRPAAPRRFETELADTLMALVTMPTLGIHYAERRDIVIRRVLLPRSRYHVYFSHDEQADIVEIRAIWHSARGRGPAL